MNFMGKILIVDDMVEVYNKLKDKIEDADYSPNVEDALNKIREGEYTQIITDFHLGDESPKGGLKILKVASKKGIECILMSTENHEKEALKFRKTKFIFKKELIANGRR